MSNEYTPKLVPIHEREGYDLVTQDTFSLPQNIELAKEVQGTNTTARYGMYANDERAGTVDLQFNLRNKMVSFDVAVSKNGHNLGMAALRGLASLLNERGFSLETRGIMLSARGYWEHLAEKGEVVPLDSSANDLPNAEYKVLPQPALSVSDKIDQ